ncbi:hypothetical protein P4O66_015183, partial [Electrophorus voltai]
MEPDCGGTGSCGRSRGKKRPASVVTDNSAGENHSVRSSRQGANIRGKRSNSTPTVQGSVRSQITERFQISSYVILTRSHCGRPNYIIPLLRNSRPKEKRRTQKKKKNRQRSGSGGVRRQAAPPRTPCVSPVPQKGAQKTAIHRDGTTYPVENTSVTNALTITTEGEFGKEQISSAHVGNGKSEPSVKAFMSDQQLPYWVQCTKPDCGKWRQLTKEIQLTPSLALAYCCGMKLSNVKSEGPDQCSQPEDLRVAGVLDSWWSSMLILPPLLKESPASPFLSAYYPDCVGMSPSGSAHSNLHPEQRRTIQPQVSSLNPYFQPFYQPSECGKALCVRPDMMELDELYEFPEFSRDPTMYLALRNLVLAAWHRDCKEPLTVQKCAPHVIVRGLVRVRCVQELDKVLHFMTRKGLVNTGILQTNQPLLPEPYHNKKVLVIGAGASGLAAARQLKNFGLQVVVVEARERIGGRVWDDTSLGVTVGRGAQIVNGCVNNPIALMCEQLGVKMHKLSERCEILQDRGQSTDPAVDKRMDFHFNAILDVVSEWRKDKTQNQDVPLGEKIQEVYKTFLQESGLRFSELEEKVLQFHLSNLEYACASPLDQVSARSWDHNEFFAQFTGDHTLLTQGYSTPLHHLAQGLDIHFNRPVEAIDYSGNVVKVTTSNGTRYTAHKVLVTVPLALLQNNTIQFNPPLPDRKLKAVHSLGAGVIEKIALQFPHRFWDAKIQGADYFGHVPPSPEKRGLFSVFYDMTPQGDQCVLMSVITGQALTMIRDLQDAQVVNLCMTVLRELFKEQEVPDPVKYFVTHWSQDTWSRMTYSFVKTGGSGEAYDVIAEDVQGKVFFAGEVRWSYLD